MSRCNRCRRPLVVTPCATSFEPRTAALALACPHCNYAIRPPDRAVSDEVWDQLLARADAQPRPYELEEESTPPPAKPVKPTPPPAPMPLVPKCGSGHAYAEHGRVERSKGHYIAWRCKVCEKDKRLARDAARKVAS